MKKIYAYLLSMLAVAPALAIAPATTHHVPGSDRSAKLKIVGQNALTRATTTDDGFILLDEEPVYEPQGTIAHYAMNYTDENYWWAEQCLGYKFDICYDADGKTVYVRTLVPGYNRAQQGDREAWSRGTIDADGAITIPCGQIVYCNDDRSQVLYQEFMTVDEDGYIDTVVDALHLTIDAGGTLSVADDDLSVIAGVYEDDGDNSGFYGYAYDYSFEYVDDYAEITLPEGTEYQQYVLTSDDGGRFVYVAFAGDEVYFKGLTENCPDDVLVGTISDNIASIPVGTLLTSGDLRYYNFYCATAEEEETDEDDDDDWGYTTLNFTPVNELQLNIADRTNITPVDPEVYMCEADYGYTTVETYVNNIRIAAYAGDVAATPATPSIEWYDDYEAFSITIPSTDVDGNYINPDKLTYTLVIDGEDFTFTTDRYEAFAEDLTALPYNFTDGWDVYSSGADKFIYYNGDDFTTAGVYSTYTVDGDARRSAIAYAGDNSGIREVTEESKAGDGAIHDLLGRRLNAVPSHGIIIKDGKKMAL